MDFVLREGFEPPKRYQENLVSARLCSLTRHKSIHTDKPRIELDRLTYRHQGDISISMYWFGGSYWDWTSDLILVRDLLYRWAKEPYELLGTWAYARTRITPQEYYPNVRQQFSLLMMKRQHCTLGPLLGNDWHSVANDKTANQPNFVRSFLLIPSNWRSNSVGQSSEHLVNVCVSTSVQHLLLSA